tara:strand:- start:351 stop:707 length:357 start_codon:yes stop_codon:yes gene_type:complete
MRPTSQRLALAKILFENGHRHVTAEALYAEARNCIVHISLATVYNSLNQFTQSGLLREIIVDSQRCYFDTNTSDHHHFFCEKTNTLEDIAFDDVILSKLPDAPEGKSITRVDVIVRVS